MRKASLIGEYMSLNKEVLEKQKQERLGARVKCRSQECYATVIEYINASNVIIQFDDDEKSVKKTRWYLFERGMIRSDNIPMKIKGKLNRMNTYDLSGDYGIGTLKNSDQTFLFDKEEYDFINRYSWFLNGKGYVSTHIKRKEVRLHTLIMNKYIGYDYIKEGLECDHINRIRTDNRKINLRIVTPRINSLNKNSIINGGVSYSSLKENWMAYMNFEGKYYHIGYYDTEEEARLARQKAWEEINNGTYNAPNYKYDKTKYIYEGQEYNLKSLCRVFDVNYDHTRYMKKTGKSIQDILDPNIIEIG